MSQVFQLFSRFNRLTKSNYKAYRANYKWPESITSANGFLKDKVLYLPDSLVCKDFETAGMVIINDIIGFEKEKQLSAITLNHASLPEWYLKTRIEQLKHVKEHYCFQQSKQFNRFEIVALQKDRNGVFNLWLDYSINEGRIGIPVRNNHKISELENGESVRFSINGKYDFNLSSGAERAYYEFDYVIHYVGEFEKIQFMSKLKLQKEKTIVLPEKWVDERKILY